MVARRITSTRSADFVPLGTEGQRSFDLIAREAAALGAEHRALFAEPFVSPAGDSIDWYATVRGTPVPLSRLEGGEADAARTALARLTGDIEARAAELGAETDPERRRLGEALANSVVHPGDDTVFVVDGQPVLVCWAHRASRGSAPVAALTQNAPRAPVPAPAAVVPPPAASGTPPGPMAAPATTAAAARPTGLGWLWWLLWGTVGALAAAIAVVLLPACGLSFLTGLDFCERPVAAASEPVLDRRDVLEAEIRRLERELALADLACLPVPPEPERRAEAPVCAPGEELRQAAETLFLIDASRSMESGIDTPRAEEERLNGLYRQGRAGEAERLERQLRTQYGEPRMQIVKRVFGMALRELELPRVRVGSFNQCGTARISETMTDAEAVSEHIESIRTGNYTALADAIRIAAQEIDGGGPNDEPANIILVSDGFDSCNGDPCAAARRAKQAKPKLRIHVIDLSGVPELRCVAEETGGRYFERPERMDLGFLEQTLTEASGAGGECLPVEDERTEAPSPEDQEIDRRVEEAGGQRGDALQITLVWDSLSDLDLRVVLPTGCELHYQRKSACGGTLDVDRNAGNDRSRTPVENVVFQAAPPSGTYRLHVTNFEKRGVGLDAFRIRVATPGGSETFTGRLPRNKQEATFTFRYP